MTHSIDERREVAEIIRAMGTEFTCFASCSDRGAVEAMREGGCSFKAAYLADLIEPLPERTCRVEYRYRDDEPWPYAACSECGAALSYYDTVDERGEESSDLCPFCPNCGAKVVEP